MGEAADLARRYLGVIDTKDPERARELLADDYTYTGPDGQTQAGPQAAVDVMAMYLNAFPDLRLDVRNVHEEGSSAIIEFVARGTHTGDLAGTAPTGRSVEVAVCSVIEARGGKIVAEREYYDQMSMMTQLGLVPEHAHT